MAFFGCVARDVLVARSSRARADAGDFVGDLRGRRGACHPLPSFNPFHTQGQLLAVFVRTGDFLDLSVVSHLRDQRLRVEDAFEFGQARQVVGHAVDAEVAHELARGVVGEGLTEGVGAATDVDQALVEQGFHAAVDVHAADGLDLGLGHRLFVGHDGEGFQCGLRQAARGGLLEQAARPGEILRQRPQAERAVGLGDLERILAALEVAVQFADELAQTRGVPFRAHDFTEAARVQIFSRSEQQGEQQLVRFGNPDGRLVLVFFVILVLPCGGGGGGNGLRAVGRGGGGWIILSGAAVPVRERRVRGGDVRVRGRRGIRRVVGGGFREVLGMVFRVGSFFVHAKICFSGKMEVSGSRLQVRKLENGVARGGPFRWGSEAWALRIPAAQGASCAGAGGPGRGPGGPARDGARARYRDSSVGPLWLGTLGSGTL